MKQTITATLTVVAAISLSNCTPQNNLQRDAAIGATGGAILGGVIGNSVGDGNAARGAVIGGLLGGAGGAAVGNNKDLQQGRGYTLQQQNQQVQQPQYGQQPQY